LPLKIGKKKAQRFGFHCFLTCSTSLLYKWARWWPENGRADVGGWESPWWGAPVCMPGVAWPFQWGKMYLGNRCEFHQKC